MARRLAAVLVLALVGALAFLDGGPPSPASADAAPGEFSAGRAVGTVSELAREPHPVGSLASDRVRDELVRRLGAAGLQTRVQASVGASVRDGSMAAAAVENVVATLPGTAPTGTVVLAAHYDSVARGPGAADDMSSVASILEAVRALRAGPPLRNDLVVLITDGEEAGLLGARAWVRDELAPSRRPTVTVNFEARGTSGPSLMFQTSPGNAELVRAFADAVPHPTGDSSLVELYKLLPNDTDLTTVLDAGRAGMNFAFVDEPIDYHTTGDSPANLSAASVQGHGEAALGMARALGSADLAPFDPAVSGAASPGDRTYFRFLGTLITYPQGLVWIPAVLAAVVLAGAVGAGRARRLLTIRGTLGATGATLLAAAVGAAGSIGVWQAVVALRPSYADTGPFLARPLLFQLGAVALAVTVTALFLLLLRRRPGRFASATGACLVFVVLGLVTAALLPGMSFLFAWPALGAALGLGAAVLLRDRPVVATAVATVAAIPAAVLLLPFGWVAFGLSGIADGIPVAVFVLTLALVSVATLPPVGTRRAWAAPVAGVLLVVALTAAGMLVDRPSREHPQATSLAFLQDVDTGVATWASSDTAPAEWTRRYVSSDPAPLPAWTGTTPVRTGPAPALAVPGPAVTVVQRAAGRVVLQVASPRGAPTVLLRADRPLRSATVVYPGRPPVTATPDGRQVRLDAVPAAGVRVELTSAGPFGLLVSDVSTGLDGLPGFVPRPPELRGAANRNSDQVVLTRRVSV